MIYFSTVQLSFIILCPILIIVLGCILYYIFYHFSYEKKHFRDIVYKQISKIVMDHDFLLINNFKFKIDGTTTKEVNHIVFAGKFIFVINIIDYCWALRGAETDKSYIITSRDGKRNYINNPLYEIESTMESISNKFGLEKSYFRGICLVNNGCNLNVKNDGINKICKIKNLGKIIKICEENEEFMLNQNALLEAAKKISKFNLNK